MQVPYYKFNCLFSPPVLLVLNGLGPMAFKQSLVFEKS